MKLECVHDVVPIGQNSKRPISRTIDVVVVALMIVYSAVAVDQRRGAGGLHMVVLPMAQAAFCGQMAHA